MKEDLSESEWRQKLGEDAYYVMRRSGTERPFSSAYCEIQAEGNYVCKGCGEALFSASAQFDSGCGWPSFDEPKFHDGIQEVLDSSHGMVRVEVRCGSCDSHLGHLFPDGPTSSGNRYCINGICLTHEV
jgi:peptide-methionine (R)-S-oxide reductase